LDPAIRHTVVHHSSTSTYIPNFIQIEETFCGRTDGRMYGRTDVRTDGHFPPLILLGRLLEVDLTINNNQTKEQWNMQQCRNHTSDNRSDRLITSSWLLEGWRNSKVNLETGSLFHIMHWSLSVFML